MFYLFLFTPKKYFQQQNVVKQMINRQIKRISRNRLSPRLSAQIQFVFRRMFALCDSLWRSVRKSVTFVTIYNASARNLCFLDIFIHVFWITTVRSFFSITHVPIISIKMVILDKSISVICCKYNINPLLVCWMSDLTY